MKDSNEKTKSGGTRRGAYTSLMLLLFALVAATAASVAWFSIADRTKLSSIDMQVTAGVSLKFDLDPHETIDGYIKTLTFEDIKDRIKRDLKVDIEEARLQPVTTEDGKKFIYEDGTEAKAETGAYIEVMLNFMSANDMLVHLTSSNSNQGQGGTLVSSKNENLPEAMRISFTADGHTWIYDPGMGDASETKDDVTIFGLPDSKSMVYNENNTLFSMKTGINKPVLMHIWLEGTDEKCTDELRKADYKISLRFEGTDSDNKNLMEK